MGSTYVPQKAESSSALQRRAVEQNVYGRNGQQRAYAHSSLDGGAPGSSSSEHDVVLEVVGTAIAGEDGGMCVAIDHATQNDIIDMEDVQAVEVGNDTDGNQVLTLFVEPSDERMALYESRLQALQGQALNRRKTHPMHDTIHSRYQLLGGIEEVRETHEHDFSEEDARIFGIRVPQGAKGRRARVFGSCRCPECGQTFVNTARLERHLAVHQVFGSFLCPLCGKTYKYEYNLFYHWRRTCRDLNDLLGDSEDRRLMDVNSLRTIVDEVAQKKAEIGPIDIGVSRSVLFQTGPLSKLEMPTNPLGRRGSACRACGVIILASHMPRHLQIHRGDLPVDERSSCGGFYCDLCGLMFRQHFNLIKHWRSACPEIQANLPDDIELTLDDQQLRGMVADLTKKAATIDIDDADIVIAQQARKGLAMDYRRDSLVLDDLDLDAYPDDEERIAEEQGLVFADDFMDEEVLQGAGASSSAIHGASSQERAKWDMGQGPVQCPECFRSFANVGRLERHLAGFHSSFGSHHCILCGNRFKYDYNLLYHYRRSCPYTKAFVDRDVREQMDATSLRKVVRQLAQKEVRLTPQMGNASRVVNLKTGLSNDEMIRRQMMRVSTVTQQPPPHLLVARQGLGDSKQCPICNIVFYGTSAIDRHMRHAHGLTLAEYEAEQEEQANQQHVYAEEFVEEEPEDVEPPPTLEPQVQGESAPPPLPLSLQGPEEEPSDRRRHLVQVRSRNGEVVEELAVDGLEHVQQLIECGLLRLEDGDEVMLVENADSGTIYHEPSPSHQHNEGTSAGEHLQQLPDRTQIGEIAYTEEGQVVLEPHIDNDQIEQVFLDADQMGHVEHFVNEEAHEGTEGEQKSVPLVQTTEAGPGPSGQPHQDVPRQQGMAPGQHRMTRKRTLTEASDVSASGSPLRRSTRRH